MIDELKNIVEDLHTDVLRFLETGCKVADGDETLVKHLVELGKYRNRYGLPEQVKALLEDLDDSGTSLYSSGEPEPFLQFLTRVRFFRYAFSEVRKIEGALQGEIQ